MSKHDIEDDELVGLSEEERAALEEDDTDLSDDNDEDDLDGDDSGTDDDDGSDNDEEADGDNADDDSDSDADDLDNSDDDAADGDNEGTDDDGEGQESGAQNNEPEPPPEFQPKLHAEPVEDYEQKIKAIDDRIAELDNQFEDGDIDNREYRTALRKAENEASDLRLQQNNYEIAVRSNQKSAEDRWQWEQDRFFGQEANQAYRSNNILGTAFDAAVKDLAAMPENQNKSMAWFLEEADRQVRSVMNVPGNKTTAGGAKETKTTDKSNAAGKSGKKNNKPIPPNLGDMPGADQPDVDNGDEFSHLDRLEGIELERALAKLPEVEQERYLKG